MFFNGELQIRRHQDRNVAIEIDGLSCRGRGTATGFDEINLLLSVKTGRLGGSVRRQCRIGVRIEITQDGAFLCGILRIASGENVPLAERTVGGTGRGVMPVGKIEVDAIAGGLRLVPMDDRHARSQD